MNVFNSCGYENVWEHIGFQSIHTKKVYCEQTTELKVTQFKF